MVSVTFRNYNIDEVIQAVIKSGLNGIEWGGDIHVPPGDIKKAVYTTNACSASGLEIFSYGSYYRAGQKKEFLPFVKTAAAIGAPNIRIWAGIKGSAEIKDEYTDIIADIRICADMAAAYGMTISFEYHCGTLTDNPESAINLIMDSDRENVFLYWQPNQFKNIDYNVYALKKVLPFLSNIHVFNWDNNSKYPLSKGYDSWQKFINIIKADGKSHGFFLEFSPDNTENAFLNDAQTLNSWMKTP